MRQWAALGHLDIPGENMSLCLVQTCGAALGPDPAEQLRMYLDHPWPSYFCLLLLSYKYPSSSSRMAPVQGCITQPSAGLCYDARAAE